MLVEFKVQNFLSFKEATTFSMVASTIKEYQETNVHELKNINLLATAVIYGANASGKSNLFKAMQFMKDFVIASSKSMQVGEKININKFKLSTDTSEKPSSFEILFIQNDIMYRYGFNTQETKIIDEWLYWKKNKKETLLFSRHEGVFDIRTSFKEGVDLKDKTRENALFLSVVAQFNGKISTDILKWFSNFTVISGLTDRYIKNTFDFLDDEYSKGKEIILNLLNVTDLGIHDFDVKHDEEITFDNYVDEKSLTGFKKIFINRIQISPDVTTLHKKYDSNNNFIGLEKFNMIEEESEGTKKIFALSGKLVETILQNQVLVIDELDSRLHPLLTRFIIEMFQNKTNSRAQLIFNTHDTNLLSNRFFRRDQIWFAEKDTYGATELYSLIEYKVRKDASFGKDYLMGKYGAIPFIDSSMFYGGILEDGE